MIREHAKGQQPSVAVPNMPTQPPAGKSVTIHGMLKYACHLIAAGIKYILKPTFETSVGLKAA